MDKQENHHFVGIDVGSGSARACVVDDTGKLVASASHNTQTWTSVPGSYEQSTRDIWQSVCVAVKAAVMEARINVDTVQSITFAATCSLAVFQRDTTEPMSISPPAFSGDDHNVLLWMHNLATKEAELINSLKHESVRYLGGYISPLMALPKALWLKNNMPEALFRKCQFYDLHDALSHIAMGGRIPACRDCCNPPALSYGYGIDGTIKSWSPDLLMQIGLEELQELKLRKLGGLCDNGHPLTLGSPIGTLCEDRARELGLPTSVMVASGTIDCYAGWVGTVGAKVNGPNPDFDAEVSERLAVAAGTSSCHILASRAAGLVGGIWGPYEDFLLPGTNVIAGGQSATGHLLQYVFDTHPATPSARSLAESQGLTIFEYMNHHLSEMQRTSSAPNITHLARHLFFYGDHFGNRSPLGDARMKGAIVGLSGDKSIDNLAVMYFGALEFLALQTHHIISTMRNGKHTIKAIFMSGSLCQNGLFVDLLSTACDLPVVIPAYIHAATCYGSALLGATAARKKLGTPGHSLWSTMEDMSRPGKVFLPSKDSYMKELLDVKYVIFLELAERQRVFRERIDIVSKAYNA